MDVILASGSPRRRQLLEMCGYTVEVRRPDVDEAALENETIDKTLRRLSEKKARAVLENAGTASDTAPIVAGDTVVVVVDAAGSETAIGKPVDAAGSETAIGKPVDAADARRILRELSGTWHEVRSGYCIGSPDPGPNAYQFTTAVVSTRVRLRELTDSAIEAYVATGEPLDKAGAYGIQEQGAALVAEVDGSYTNVVGLPLEEVIAALEQLASH